MSLYRLLTSRGPWGMTVGQWLASLAVGPSGGWGWFLIASGKVWTGMLALVFAQGLYYLLMGHDFDDRSET